MPENCVVYLRYQGYFEYQEMPFDSTLMQCEAKGDDSLRINLAAGGLIPGLHLGVLSMRKGEKAELLIHPDYAYGKMGCPPRIPPGKIGPKVCKDFFEIFIESSMFWLQVTTFHFEMYMHNIYKYNATCTFKHTSVKTKIIFKFLL